MKISLFPATTALIGLVACKGDTTNNERTMPENITTTTTQTGKAPESDTSFMNLIALGNLAKLDEQAAALTHSADNKVLEAARSIKAIHETVKEDIHNYASAHGIALPAKAEEHSEAILKAMCSKTGAAFDADYTSHQVSGHTRYLGLFEDNNGKMQDPALNRFIEAHIPVVKNLLALSQQLQSAL